MAKSAAEILEEARKAAATRKSTEERLAEAKAAREEKLAAQKAARPTAKETMTAKAEASKLEYGKKIAERAWESASTTDGNLDPQSLADWELWLYDKETGKKRTTKEIIAAVTDAVLADKSSRWQGVSLDPATGKPRPSSDAEKVRAAMAQLISNAQRAGKYRQDALAIANELRGDFRRAATEALANRPETWQYRKEDIGKIVTRQNFEDPYPISVLVLDPTKNQLTPEQLKQFPSISSLGGMAIDPVTGFQVMIDNQGRYTLGEQPEGDVTGLDYSKYQPSYTPPDYRLYTIGGTDSAGGMGGTGGTGGTGGRPGAPDSLTQADVDTAVAKAVAAATAKTDALVKEQKAQAAAAAFATKVKASDRLKAMFDGVGLGSLAPFIDKRIMEDASEESVLLELYDQPEYQARFPGMKALRSKGKTITEAEYIKDEKAFAQTARFFDLPVGFYDSPDDFGKLIGNLVSPKEYQDRLQVGQDLGRSLSPGVKTQLQELYNIGEGGITAYVLDSDRALPLLQKQAKAAQFVGFGRERGFKLEGMTAAQAEQIAGTEAYSKLSAQQMQTALSQAAQLRTTQSRLTGIEGEVYNEGEALSAVIEGSPEAILASQQRAQREGARFGGGSGVTGSSLRSTTMI